MLPQLVHYSDRGILGEWGVCMAHHPSAIDPVCMILCLVSMLPPWSPSSRGIHGMGSWNSGVPDLRQVLQGLCNIQTPFLAIPPGSHSLSSRYLFPPPEAARSACPNCEIFKPIACRKIIYTSSGGLPELMKMLKSKVCYPSAAFPYPNFSCKNGPHCNESPYSLPEKSLG